MTIDEKLAIICEATELSKAGDNEGFTIQGKEREGRIFYEEDIAETPFAFRRHNRPLPPKSLSYS
jgi:hypothetical protein